MKWNMNLWNENGKPILRFQTPNGAVSSDFFDCRRFWGVGYGINRYFARFWPMLALTFFVKSDKMDSKSDIVSQILNLSLDGKIILLEERESRCGERGENYKFVAFESLPLVRFGKWSVNPSSFIDSLPLSFSVPLNHGRSSEV